VPDPPAAPNRSPATRDHPPAAPDRSPAELPPRAWRVRRLGSPADALRLEAATASSPGPQEARVAVTAVGLNFPDLLVCAGLYQERPLPPFTPGFEAAGTVVEAGRGSAWRRGQQVIVVPELPNGSFQESVTVPDGQLYPVPDTMAAEAAATLHIAYQTAHFALHRRAAVGRGETVVVTGAGGGVGAATLQLARAAGARVVAVVGSSPKAAACRAWGADEVIDASQCADFASTVMELTDGRGAGVVVDVVGGDVAEQARRCVAFEGRLVVVGFAGGGIESVPANHVLLRNYSVVGLHLARYRRHNPQLLRSVHAELVRLWRTGAIAPPLDRVIPFEDAVDGLEAIRRRQVVGRVVLRAGGRG
jgi:NADPH2:quinone reductase